MDKILLILSTTRKSDKCVKEAVDIASKENAMLIILFVVDYEVPQKIFDSLTEEGWIGGKTTENLFNAVLDEYSVQGKTRSWRSKRWPKTGALITNRLSKEVRF
jgi:hypothetical protein